MDKQCPATFGILKVMLLNIHSRILARSQYSEGPATSHLDTGFFWFPPA